MRSILLLFINISFAVIANAQQSSWTAKDRSAFITECQKSAGSIGRDSANFYCHCTQEKMEAKYPNLAEAEKLTAEDLEKPEIKKLMLDCLKGNWTVKQRAEFMTDCVSAAKEGMAEEKALSYCGCMMYKIEANLPDYADALKLTAEDLQKPEWKKKILDCIK